MQLHQCVSSILVKFNRSIVFERNNGRLYYSGFKSSNKQLTLFGDEISPPVRFVLMTAYMTNIELTFQKVNLFKSEHKTEFYEKINPLLKVPALKTENGVIIDSHAIALYLCNVSANPTALYPSDPMLLAKVHQMLFFHSSVLFPIDSAIFTEFFKGKGPVREELIARWYLALDFLETQLCGGWLAGNKVTVCDLCCSATVTSLMLLVPLLEKHQNIKQWLDNVQKVPCFDINSRGLQQLSHYIVDSFLNK